MKYVRAIALVSIVCLGVCGCAHNAKETQLQEFVTSHVEKIKPLEKEAGLAWWDAATTGAPEAYDRLSTLKLEICKVYSNADEFACVKGFKESGQIEDPLLARQVTVLYHGYLANQIEPELLAEIVKLMLLYPELSLEIQGHTDNQGTAEHNLDLSRRRADTVRRFILLFGVGESRLVSEGYGLTRPVAPNDTEEGRAKNRRVELVKR